MSVGFLQWIRQLNLNSVPWTCNLTVFLTKMWYADEGININVGRKTNMSRAHAQAHKKQVTSGTIIPKQEGFHTRFCPSEGRFLFHSYTKLALRCMFAVRDSFLADYHTSMDVSAGAVRLHAWCEHVIILTADKAIHSGIFNKTTESHSIILRPKGKLLHRCVELACAK